MRGQEHLLVLRKRGFVPRMGVLVMVAEDDPGHWADTQPDEDAGAMNLWVKPSELRPDLWCVVALDVVVWCSYDGDVEAVKRISRQCKDAGAKGVIGVRIGREQNDEVFVEL